MERWYIVPIDYNEFNEIIPRFSDGYDITYFGDNPFIGYSGVIIENYYIIKIYADKEIHDKLAEQNEIKILTNDEVVTMLNKKFKQNCSFEEWNDRFCCEK